MIDKLTRRVAGWHDIRLDGISDLLLRANGASVMDIGCNRGMVALEFYANGATVVHGCDSYIDGIETASHVFCDRRSVDAKFEVVDLSIGPSALAPFGSRKYDIIVMLATVHKLKRIMPQGLLSDLMRDIGNRTVKYFGWRATSEKFDENELEMKMLDGIFGSCGMKRIQTSYISDELGVAAIWARK